MKYHSLILLAMTLTSYEAFSFMNWQWGSVQTSKTEIDYCKPESGRMIDGPQKCWKTDMDEETYDILDYVTIKQINFELSKSINTTFLKIFNEENITETIAEVKEDLRTLKELHKAHNITQSKSYENLLNISIKFHDEQNRILEHMNERYETTMNDTKTQIQTTENTIIKMLQTEVKGLKTSVSECTNKVTSIEEQSLAQDKLLYTLLFLVLVLLWMNIGDRRYSSASPTTTQPRHESPDYRLKLNQPKEDAICVITFHTDTEGTHVRTSRSVFESGGQTPPRIVSRVVHEHSDISDLPGCVVYFVFVDYNDRNVILEDPEKGLGSLRLTTVRSLLQFGGDVTVIYCGDKNSRSLTSDLYSHYLTSVDSQDELKMLKSKGRMLSIDKDFTEHQKQHCRSFINSLLKDRHLQP